MEPGSPEAILAWYSCARRLHIVRLARDRPRNFARAASISLWLASLRKPEPLRLGERHPQCHAIPIEKYHEHAQGMTSDLLRLDANDLADAMAWIDDEIT